MYIVHICKGFCNFLFNQTVQIGSSDIYYKKTGTSKSSKSLNSSNITNMRIRIFQTAMRRVEHRRIRNIGIRKDTDHVEAFEYLNDPKNRKIGCRR
jgi:hypothetical protein